MKVAGCAWVNLQLQTQPDLSRSALQVAAKQAAAAATQTIAASQNAAASNKNPAAQQQLVQSCKVRIHRGGPDSVRMPSILVTELRQDFQPPNLVCSAPCSRCTHVWFLSIKWTGCVWRENINVFPHTPPPAVLYFFCLHSFLFERLNQRESMRRPF